MMDIIDELAKSNPAKLKLPEAIEVLECEKKLNGEVVNRLHCYPENQGKRSRTEIINMAINTVVEEINKKPNKKIKSSQYNETLYKELEKVKWERDIAERALRELGYNIHDIRFLAKRKEN